MKNLNINAKTGDKFETFPEVIFNSTTGILNISGKSSMDNAVKFYTVLTEWLIEYLETKPTQTYFKIDLKYYNTSSSKCIYLLLELLKDFKECGGNVEINWFYPKDDEILKEDIEIMFEELELDVNLIAN